MEEEEGSGIDWTQDTGDIIFKSGHHSLLLMSPSHLYFSRWPRRYIRETKWIFPWLWIIQENRSSWFILATGWLIVFTNKNCTRGFNIFLRSLIQFTRMQPQPQVQYLPKRWKTPPMSSFQIQHQFLYCWQPPSPLAEGQMMLLQ